MNPIKLKTRIALSPSHLIALSLLIFLAGCNSPHKLEQRTDADRPDFASTPLPNPGPAPLPPLHVDIINAEPSISIPLTETTITGTWTFTTPPTVTTIEHKTADYHQFSLYQGRPTPSDTPFVVITVSADPRSQADADPNTYKTHQTRLYLLNGNIAKEWNGLTNTGAAFNELILSRPGLAKGDLCHAVAIAKNETQRKLALEILTSLTWKPTGGNQ